MRKSSVPVPSPSASPSPSSPSTEGRKSSLSSQSTSPPVESKAASTIGSLIGWWSNTPSSAVVEEPPYESDDEDMELVLPHSKKPGASHLVRVARTTKLGSMMLPILNSYRNCQLKVEKLRKQEKDDAVFEKLREEMMDAQHNSQSKAMKNILETMGGLYNKGAQLAASQQMIMPPALIEELKTCFEDMPAREWKLIVPSIYKCLGKGDKKRGKEVMEAEFLEFEHEPMAAASIGQVHFATLRSGQRVVVKILYPEIRKHMYADLATIETTINMIAAVLELGELKGIIEVLFKELNDNFPREMDFNIEMAHMEYARKLLSRHSKQVVVPMPFPELSGTTMLTQQLVEGDTLNKIAKENNPEKMARARDALSLVIDALGEMIFKDGFFHADPHPGNIMVQHDGRPVLIDWGQCMRLSRPQRRRLIQMVILLRTRCMELILAGLNVSGFSFPPEVTGDTAAMIFFAFDSAISSPFTNDIHKLGAKIRSSPSKLSVPTKAPREVIFFARVMQCLRRGNELMRLDISAVDRWTGIARRELWTMVYEDGPERNLPKPSSLQGQGKEKRDPKEALFEEEKDEDDSQLWAPSRLLLMMDTTQFHHVQDGVVWAQGHQQEADALFRLGIVGAQGLGAGFLGGMASLVTRNERVVAFALRHPWLAALVLFLLFALLQKAVWLLLAAIMDLSIGREGLHYFENAFGREM